MILFFFFFLSPPSCESLSTFTGIQQAAELCTLLYLDNKGTKDNTTEDEVVEDAFKDIPFPVDLAGVDLVEKLHQYKGVEDNGVVFRGRGVQGSISAVVYIKQSLSCRDNGKENVF